MAVISTSFPTLMDVARRSGSDSIRQVVEILNETNYALDDIPWLQCNSGSSHITTIRTGIPTPTWRMLNSGVPTQKSTTAQIKAHTGMLETYAEVDKMQVALAARNGDAEAAPNFLASENSAFIEGFSQEISRVLFYGDPSSPKEPVGLINYYNSKSAGDTKKNVLDAGGTGSDNTSIWLICWGDRAIHGLYPQGSKAGLEENFLGEVTLEDADGRKYQGFRTHYKWDAGFVVRDWRCAVRIANIDMSDITANNSSAADLAALMTRAVHLLPKAAFNVRKAFYCRPEILTALDLQVQNKSSLALKHSEVFGREVLDFRGIPIREQESLLDSEARVV